VISHLPPARLAGAMIGGRGDAADEQLVERLQWVQVRAGGNACLLGESMTDGQQTNI